MADGRPGWFGGALVPVAVPLMADPALVLLGLSAGADLGVWFVAGVLAIGVGATTAATRAPTEPGTAHTVAAWAQRLVTAVALAACVLLVVNAVFDV